MEVLSSTSAELPTSYITQLRSSFVYLVIDMGLSGARRVAPRVGDARPSMVAPEGPPRA
ncbi:hypothetical protein Pcatena_05680 [Parolsenella catena]|uniref:Uncharacterized protein n=1 Tax=Parolsenella catena TaxID=2003188 RepID=A0A3G9JWX2_9ACTN|nr:hypothetical protein Pcatena_05680 [Parolsenella catena]